jgi:hypothetical protein
MTVDETTNERNSDETDGIDTPKIVMAEHQQLSELLAQLGLSLGESFDSALSEQLAKQLDENMEAHFGREESLYYPTLWALRPQLEEALRRLTARHEGFRTNLAALRESLRSGATTEAQEQLAAFATRFREHEVAEERILDSLRSDEAAPTN